MRAIEERFALLQMLRGALSGNDVYLRIGAELADPSLRGRLDRRRELRRREA